MKTIQNIFLGVLLAYFATTFAACSKSEDNKGPMEKAGRSVDQALGKAKEQTGKAMEKAGEAIKEAGEKVREGGEKAQKQ